MSEIEQLQEKIKELQRDIKREKYRKKIEREQLEYETQMNNKRAIRNDLDALKNLISEENQQITYIYRLVKSFDERLENK